MAIEQNLKRGNPATQFTCGRVAVENQKKSVESRNRKKRDREEWDELFSLPMKDGDLDELTSITGIKGANLTLSKQLKAVLVREALKGNLKAYELLMRYAGMEEPEPQEAPQEQTNGFVNALNGTAAEVWANEAPEKE